jgi:hypothetical protein
MTTMSKVLKVASLQSLDPFCPVIFSWRAGGLGHISWHCSFSAVFV